MGSILVTGIVAVRDKQPYVQLSNENGIVAQLTMKQAQAVAMDLIVMATRTEADAMLLRFFDKHEFPEEAGSRLMQMFRDYRSELDAEKLERSEDRG